MRRTLEKDVERKAALWARNHDIMAIKMLGNNQRGVPDREFLYKGHCLFMEFKVPIGGRLSMYQNVFQRKLKTSGFEVHNITNYEEAVEILKNWKKEVDDGK